MAVKCDQRIQIVQVFRDKSRRKIASSAAPWFLFGLFSCVHVTADCYRDNSHWLLTRVQGGCLEPKWQWPFWYSAALFLTNSCFHPIGGVGGSCGSATPFRYQHNRDSRRCDWRWVLNTEKAMQCDAKFWRCAFSLRKYSAMRSDNAKHSRCDAAMPATQRKTSRFTPAKRGPSDPCDPICIGRSRLSGTGMSGTSWSSLEPQGLALLS